MLLIPIAEELIRLLGCTHPVRTISIVGLLRWREVTDKVNILSRCYMSGVVRFRC